MEMNFESLLQKLTDFIHKEAKTETVIGEPFELGEFKCIPVIRLGLGFGSGGGSGDANKNGKGEGGGAGAGLGIDPIGFLVSRGDQISFVSTQGNKSLSAIFEKVPELIKKVMAREKSS